MEKLDMQTKKIVQDNFMYELSEINPRYELFIDTINNPTDFKTSLIQSFNEDFELLKATYDKWIRENKTVHASSPKDGIPAILRKPRGITYKAVKQELENLVDEFIERVGL